MDSSLPNLFLSPAQTLPVVRNFIRLFAVVVLDVCCSCIWLECVELMTVACTTDDATKYVVPLGKVACMM